jgi:hypothetical protein
MRERKTQHRATISVIPIRPCYPACRIACTTRRVRYRRAAGTLLPCPAGHREIDDRGALRPRIRVHLWCPVSIEQEGCCSSPPSIGGVVFVRLLLLKGIVLRRLNLSVVLIDFRVPFVGVFGRFRNVRVSSTPAAGTSTETAAGFCASRLVSSAFARNRITRAARSPAGSRSLRLRVPYSPRKSYNMADLQGWPLCASVRPFSPGASFISESIWAAVRRSVNTIKERAEKNHATMHITCNQWYG